MTAPRQAASRFDVPWQGETTCRVEHYVGRPRVKLHYQPARSEADFTAFARVVAFLHARSEKAPSLREAACHVGASVPTFTRLFRRMTGTTFIAYLNQWRIDRACTLLQETRSPILDICLAVGFNNLSHFNRQFRRLTGMTPREYRRKGARG